MNQLKINEIFASINGESTYIGLPFVFVRTSGCPLRCSWCDTRYAYDEGEDKSISDILREIEEFSIPNVLLTGGEPLLQPASLELMSQLLERDYQVVLETGGALNIADVPGGVAVVMDLKCPSSGMSERMHWDNIEHLTEDDQIKFVLADARDYEYAKNLMMRYKLAGRCPVLFQPAFGLLNPATLVRWILADRLDVRCLIQQHKVIWPPEQRGV